MTRDLEFLSLAESIKGEPIDKDSLAYLEHFAKSNGLLRVEIGSAGKFSRPIQFFRNQKLKFQYLQNGKLVPFDSLCGKRFIAFKVKQRALVVFGYFPGEYS